MTGTSHGWWRRNRLWLPLVPVAVVLAMLASSYRVKSLWYDDGLHHRTASAHAGDFVTMVDGYRDTGGPTTRTLRVRLSGLEPVDRVPTPPGVLTDDDTMPVQPGVTAYRVTLDFTAAPDQELYYCHVALVDSDGHRYGGGSPDPLGQSNFCLPTGHEGPDPALVKGTKRGAVPEGHARPRAWTVHRVIEVRKGARISQARLWFDLPDYVRLPAPR